MVTTIKIPQTTRVTKIHIHPELEDVFSVAAGVVIFVSVGGFDNSMGGTPSLTPLVLIGGFSEVRSDDSSEDFERLVFKVLSSTDSMAIEEVPNGLPIGPIVVVFDGPVVTFSLTTRPQIITNNSKL